MIYQRLPGNTEDFPYYVEAFRWWPTMGAVGGVRLDTPNGFTGFLDTPRGEVEVAPGDWIVQESDSVVMVWQHQVFVESYAPVKEPEP